MSNPRPHLLIIDALNLIRRLHAVQAQQALTPAQALIATRANLINTCRKLLAGSEPTHVIAVFDGEVHSWRKEVYPAYKEGRTPMPAELREGLNELQDAFWECGVDALLSQTDEADDLIATLASGIAQHGASATIISTDKGFCQLICPQIRIRDYFNKRWLDAAFVEQQYGVAPAQLVDFWALTGIGGSNIKGVPGIGPKTATQLLQQYGDLAAMLTACQQEDAAKPLLKLRQHQDEALLAQRLVRLQRDIPLGFNLREIRYPPAPDA
ncbi:flap endonuclease Xni [Aeromonas dhakensis]|uniref:flap endonuclease Xni n=1 Tax=Aeromonas dhakensis TaxID=196024 RepID=UPI0028927FA1|nr:flap endonuclease Xni [Aeromonas dhakensis]HDZ8897664.1 flap endonuclease Xni [Aeromonas dhakensis]